MSYQQGQIIVNRYEILSVLGGGMGEVYEALDRKMGRKVALKVIKEEESDPDILGRFEGEWKTLVQLDHPNILPIYEADKDGDRWFFTTPLLKGQTFTELIRQGPMPWREAAEYGLDLTRALEFVHSQKIVHGDIKPDNVFLTEHRHVKLIDFGIATSTHSSSGAGSGFCTQGFASPEQLRGGVVDARSDIFSFGILLYLLVSASHPFDEIWLRIVSAAPAPELSPAVATPEFITLVQRCLEKDREARFATIREVAEALLYALTPPTIEILSSDQFVDESQTDDVRLDDRRASHPYRTTVASIVREVLGESFVRPLIRYVPAPPAALKTHVLYDIRRQVKSHCMVVGVAPAGPKADVTTFFPNLKTELAQKGIRSSSAEPERLLAAVEGRQKRVVILLDGYHHYFHDLDRQNEDAIGVWAAGIEALCASRSVMIVMAGSVDPIHFYGKRGPGSLPLRISGLRLDASWDAWQEELAAAYEVDSAAVKALGTLAEHHAGAVLEGVEALSNGSPGDKSIHATLQLAGESAKWVVPECCRAALGHCARSEAIDIRCKQTLEEAGFLRSVEGVAVPAVSLWRAIWAEAG